MHNKYLQTTKKLKSYTFKNIKKNPAVGFGGKEFPAFFKAFHSPCPGFIREIDNAEKSFGDLLRISWFNKISIILIQIVFHIAYFCADNRITCCQVFPEFKWESCIGKT